MLPGLHVDASVDQFGGTYGFAVSITFLEPEAASPEYAAGSLTISL